MIICCLIRVVDWSKHNRKLDYQNQMNFQAQSFFYIVSNRDLLKNFPILCSIYSNRTRRYVKNLKKIRKCIWRPPYIHSNIPPKHHSLRVGGSYTSLQLSRLRFFSFLSRCKYGPALMHGDLCLFRFIIMFACGAWVRDIPKVQGQTWLAHPMPLISGMPPPYTKPTTRRSFTMFLTLNSNLQNPEKMS